MDIIDVDEEDDPLLFEPEFQNRTHITPRKRKENFKKTYIIKKKEKHKPRGRGKPKGSKRAPAKPQPEEPIQ